MRGLVASAGRIVGRASAATTTQTRPRRAGRAARFAGRFRLVRAPGADGARIGPHGRAGAPSPDATDGSRPRVAQGRRREPGGRSEPGGSRRGNGPSGPAPPPALHPAAWPGRPERHVRLRTARRQPGPGGPGRAVLVHPTKGRRAPVPVERLTVRRDPAGPTSTGPAPAAPRPPAGQPHRRRPAPPRPRRPPRRPTGTDADRPRPGRATPTRGSQRDDRPAAGMGRRSPGQRFRLRRASTAVAPCAIPRAGIGRPAGLTRRRQRPPSRDAGLDATTRKWGSVARRGARALNQPAGDGPSASEVWRDAVARAGPAGRPPDRAEPDWAPEETWIEEAVPDRSEAPGNRARSPAGASSVGADFATSPPGERESLLLAAGVAASRDPSWTSCRPPRVRNAGRESPPAWRMPPTPTRRSVIRRPAASCAPSRMKYPARRRSVSCTGWCCTALASGRTRPGSWRPTGSSAVRLISIQCWPTAIGP